MAGKSGNEDVSSYPISDRHLTELRKELEGKIEARVQIWMFTFVMLVVISAVGYAFIVINNTNDKINSLGNRITAIEARLTSHNIH